MPTYINQATGFPDETPCPTCGWPLYCCLCSPDDDQPDSIFGEVAQAIEAENRAAEIANMCTPQATFVQAIATENTGGNVMCDYIVLSDLTLLVINSDAIYLYASHEALENSEPPIATIYRQATA